MHKYSWDDLKIALAVARAGSISGAAKELGVAHTTVSRRLAALETATGTRLFDRTSRGYDLNHDNLAAIEALTAAGAAVEEAEARIAALNRAHGDNLRLTSTDTLCTTILPQVVARLSESQPGLTISLISQNAHENLAHGAADMALRPTTKLPDDLEGEVVGEMGICVFAAPGAPDEWIGLTGPLSRSRPGALIAETGPTKRAADSFLVVRELVAAGLGKSYLPCILGEGDARMKRDEGAEMVFVPLWLVGHRELADTGRLRRARRLLADEIRKHAHEIRGEVPFAAR